MNAKELRAAAEELLRATESQELSWRLDDADIARHILTTVRDDDDDPVTRESCLAMGAKIYGPKKYGFDCPGGPSLIVDMTEAETVETEIYVEAFDNRVTIKWSPTNYDLRRLVAALGE